MSARKVRLVNYRERGGGGVNYRGKEGKRKVHGVVGRERRRHLLHIRSKRVGNGGGMERNGEERH